MQEPLACGREAEGAMTCSVECSEQIVSKDRVEEEIWVARLPELVVRSVPSQPKNPQLTPAI